MKTTEPEWGILKKVNGVKLYGSLACWNFAADYPDEFKSYGCGPGGVGDWFVPDTMYGLDVSPACRNHDFDYRHGEGADESLRQEYDETLKDNCVRLIRAAYLKNKNVISKRIYKLRLRRAKFYYVMVRDFGGPAYWDSRHEEKQSSEVS